MIPHRNFQYTTQGRSPLFALLIFGLIIFAIFWLIRGAFYLLSMAFPFLIIATAIINYRVLKGYGKWLIDSVKANPLMGIFYILLTLLAHPFVAAYLLFKAIATRNQRSQDTHEEDYVGEYIQYEEVKKKDDFMDLEELKKENQKLDQQYRDLF